MDNQKNFDMGTLVANLDNKELLNIGLDDYVYVKALSVENEEVFAIHAADGTPLSIMDSYETALSKISESDMQAVTLH